MAIDVSSSRGRTSKDAADLAHDALAGAIVEAAVEQVNAGALDGGTGADGYTVRASAGGPLPANGAGRGGKERAWPIVRVPSDDDFFDNDYMDDPALNELLDAVVARYERLRLIEVHGISLAVLWRRKGGKKQGGPTLSKCHKPSGLLAHFCTAQFVIWIGADHIREAEYTTQQLAKMLYHECRHIGWDEGDDDHDPKAIIVGHDLEIFADELTDTGEWEHFRRAIASEFRQTSFLALGQS